MTHSLIDWLRRRRCRVQQHEPISPLPKIKVKKQQRQQQQLGDALCQCRPLYCKKNFYCFCVLEWNWQLRKCSCRWRWNKSRKHCHHHQLSFALCKMQEEEEEENKSFCSSLPFKSYCFALPLVESRWCARFFTIPFLKYKTHSGPLAFPLSLPCPFAPADWRAFLLFVDSFAIWFEFSFLPLFLHAIPFPIPIPRRRRRRRRRRNRKNTKERTSCC